jgi:hypothetical protein
VPAEGCRGADAGEGAEREGPKKGSTLEKRANTTFTQHFLRKVA